MRAQNTGELRRESIQLQAYSVENTAVRNRAKENVSEREKKKEEQSVKLNISEAIQEMLEKQAEKSREADEKNGDKIAEYRKILEIARRIARGDKVPPRDEKKLMEYSEELYQMAKSAAMLNAMKKHKKHKSLFDEEENTMSEKLRELKEGGGRLESNETVSESAETGGEENSAESEQS